MILFCLLNKEFITKEAVSKGQPHIIEDNEISLALESSPPVGPSESFNSFQTPFKQELGLV
jgi:hypothetical protein